MKSDSDEQIPRELYDAHGHVYYLETDAGTDTDYNFTTEPEDNLKNSPEENEDKNTEVVKEVLVKKISQPINHIIHEKPPKKVSPPIKYGDERRKSSLTPTNSIDKSQKPGTSRSHHQDHGHDKINVVEDDDATPKPPKSSMENPSLEKHEITGKEIAIKHEIESDGTRIYEDDRDDISEEDAVS